MIIEGRFPFGRRQVSVNSRGFITRVAKRIGAPHYLFPDYCLVLPGFVDIHVHARDDWSHKLNYKEDYRTATLAARSGGVAAIMAMPNDPVAPFDANLYARHRALMRKHIFRRKGRVFVECVKYAFVKPGGQCFSYKIPYKMYLADSFNKKLIGTYSNIVDTLEDYQNCDISFHCEHPYELRDNKKKAHHFLRRPILAERRSINELIYFLKGRQKWNIKANICHVSSKAGLEAILRAKDSGLNITCEVSPSHLFFYRNEDYKLCYELAGRERIIDDSRIKMNPPIRFKEDRDFLLSHLDGIDFLASDHAPHDKNGRDAAKNLSGIPHLDTFGNFVLWLLREKDITEDEIFRLACTSPGKFFNQFSKKKFGDVRKGFVASFVVLNYNSNTLIDAGVLETKCKWSPFEGMLMPGSIEQVFSAGIPLK